MKSEEWSSRHRELLTRQNRDKHACTLLRGLRWGDSVPYREIEVEIPWKARLKVRKPLKTTPQFLRRGIEFEQAHILNWFWVVCCGIVGTPTYFIYNLQVERRDRVSTGKWLGYEATSRHIWKDELKPHPAWEPPLNPEARFRKCHAPMRLVCIELTDPFKQRE